MKVKLSLISLSMVMGLGMAVLWMAVLNPSVQAAPTPELHVCPSGCPYTSIQSAVDAAQAGDVIKVTQGNYTDVHHKANLDTETFTATQVVAVTKPITIRGGYTMTNWTTPDPVALPTTLDAGGQGRVMVISGTNSTTIEGLRMTGGDASGLGGHYSGARDAGGGVYVYSATVIIRNCNVYSNSAHTGEWATGSGGGMYLSSANATLESNIISGNVGSARGHGYGGGLNLFDSHNASLKGNTISGNIGASANGYGGGLYLYYSEYASLEDNIIRDNVGSQGANYYGGGLYLVDSDHAILRGNLIKGNTAGAAWSWGGGVYVDRSDNVTLTGNTIEDNTASTYDGWGGGLYLRSSNDLTMSGNLFTSNAGTSNLISGESWGGGLYIERGEAMTLTNNVFADNEVTTAGSGLYIEDASPRFLHTTIARNMGGDGSGVSITGTLNTVAMTNTIIVSHTVGISVSVNSTAALNFSLWHNNTSNLGGTGTVKNFNGYTGDPAFAPDGYHLAHASAAIDQGVDAGVVTDIDGDLRPRWTGYDIGADEFMRRIYLTLVMHGEQP